MENHGVRVVASPSDETDAGHDFKEHPDSTGSLGIAISEAVEVAAQDDQTKYALGSVLNHAAASDCGGQETLAQLEQAGEYPDIVVAAGGGSNFAGIAFLHGCQPARPGAS